MKTNAADVIADLSRRRPTRTCLVGGALAFGFIPFAPRRASPPKAGNTF
jgi:hypothetical protein